MSIEVNITELKERDPRQFEREYAKWIEHSWEAFMADDVINELVAKAATLGVYVDHDRVAWSLSYSQGDGLAFDGSVRISEWMKACGYDETYPALHLAAEYYSDRAYVSASHRGYCISVNLPFDVFWSRDNDEVPGIFNGLDPFVFAELVEEQANAFEVETSIRKTCEGLAHEFFVRLRDDYEYRTSKEEFMEWAANMDVTYTIDSEE